MKSFTKTTVVAGAALSTVAAMGMLSAHLGSKSAQAKQPGQSAVQGVAKDTAIRPFRVTISEEAIIDLRRRIAATRFPDKETVTDDSQGVQLATIEKLARYWATDYDWRKVEAKLNALPQFITEIDGLDIHFIHVRSKHENALPLIVTRSEERRVGKEERSRWWT